MRAQSADSVVIGRHPAAIILVAVATGCSSTARSVDGTRVDTLETGRVIVANSVPPDVANLSFAEELRLGVALGEESNVFGNVGSLATRGDGTVFVADFITREISEFSPDGVFRRMVLRHGQGPDELRFRLGAVDLLWQPPDRLWIGDSPALMVLDSSGILERTSLDLSFSRWPARLDTLGFMYREALDLTGEAEHRWIEAYRVSADVSLTRVGERLPLESAEVRARVFRRGRAELREMHDVPMRSAVIWDVDPGGDLWVVRSGAYRIHRVTLAGDTVRTVELPLRPEPIRSAERERAAEDSPWSPAELPTHKPLIADLRVDREGWLWVRRTASGSDLPLVDVFNECGRHLGSAPVSLADHEPWLALGTARLLGVVRDELDVEYVVRLRLVRDDGGPVASAPCTF